MPQGVLHWTINASNSSTAMMLLVLIMGIEIQTLRGNKKAREVRAVLQGIRG